MISEQTDVSDKLGVLLTASNEDDSISFLKDKSNPSNVSVGCPPEIVMRCKEDNGERSVLGTGESAISPAVEESVSNGTKINGVFELRSETSENRLNQSGDLRTFDGEDNTISVKTPETISNSLAMVEQ